METSVKITSIIVGAVILLALIGVGIYYSEQPGKEVKVNGIGSVKAQPDIVSAYFNVETNGSSAKEAKDKNSEIVDEVITNLVKIGLERDQITTENFNVGPNYVYEDGDRKQKGYEASHRVKVELKNKNKDKVGEVIDSGVDSGAGISYINFELSQDKQNELKSEALKVATKDARSKAEGIASGLGKQVDDIVSVNARDFDYHPWRLYEGNQAIAIEDVERAKKAVTNVQPGDKEITGRVEVVYSLE